MCPKANSLCMSFGGSSNKKDIIYFVTVHAHILEISLNYTTSLGTKCM